MVGLGLGDSSKKLNTIVCPSHVIVIVIVIVMPIADNVTVHFEATKLSIIINYFRYYLVCSSAVEK
jgi:hypothetical protein